jgi:hypothetical protein
MKNIWLVSLLGLFFLGGCGGVVISGPGPGGHTPGHGYGNLDIPPGHLPPPGECRIWYPGVPPGQQPPPGNCYDLAPQVPLGAWLIYGPGGGHEDTLRVHVYDDHSPRVVISVRYYNFETGRFLREEEP